MTSARQIRSLIAGAAIVLVAAGFASGGRRNGLIAFQQHNSSFPFISVIAPTGSGLRRLIDDAESPAWSPDHTKIVFVRSTSATGTRDEIDLANANGSQVRTLAMGTDLELPTWSPDGRHIVFEQPATVHTYPYDLYEVGMNGSRPRKLLADAATPSFSPDGKNIAFVRTLPGAAQLDEIEIATSAGTHLHKLLRGYIGKLAWSPDRSQIAFETYTVVLRAHSGYSIPEIAVIDLDGSHQRPLTQRVGLQGNMEPTWSPDGKYIAFARDHCYPESLCPRAEQISVDLYRMNADGSHQRLLARGGAWPTWR